MAPPQLSRRWAIAGFAVVPSLLLLAATTVAGLIDPVTTAVIAASMLAGVGWLAYEARPSEHAVAAAQATSRAEIPQAFLDRLPDPVILLNGAREIVAANAAAREAFDIELLGRDLALSLRHPDVLAAVENVFDGLPTVIEEILLPVPVPRTFSLHAGELAASADVRAPRVVLVLRDETRAKRAEQSRADFVANATHELRSPLAALLGFIETLRGPASDDAAARQRFLGIMQAEGQRMARLVEDLMSLARVEINEHVLPRDHVDLGEVLGSVAETLAVRAQRRQMTIILDVPEDLPPVAGDMDQLIQMFHNLVDNAVKYARAGTPIRIEARAFDRLAGMQTPGVSVAVADQGDGIETFHLPRLTERFYRADAGRSRRCGGTGLGLAIVKHIVNRHRGRLAIESKEGAGSTFTVVLPAATLHLPDANPTAQGKSQTGQS
jgi:two-component system phosphate regulon sensor histidine kinase PhoR